MYAPTGVYTYYVWQCMVMQFVLYCRVVTTLTIPNTQGSQKILDMTYTMIYIHTACVYIHIHACYDATLYPYSCTYMYNIHTSQYYIGRPLNVTLFFANLIWAKLLYQVVRILTYSYKEIKQMESVTRKR